MASWFIIYCVEIVVGMTELPCLVKFTTVMLLVDIFSRDFTYFQVFLNGFLVCNRLCSCQCD